MYREQDKYELELERRERASSSRGIAEATLITVFAMFLVKITGFLREILIVPKFGYGLLSDAYIFSFQLPDLMFELLIGGAVAAVMTPSLAHGLEAGREKRSWRAISSFATFFISVMAFVLLLAFFLVPYIMPIMMGNGPDGTEPELATKMDLIIPVTRILLLQTFVMVCISLTNGVLQAYKRFGPASFGVVIYNIAYMVSLILLGEPLESAVRKVAWAVVLSSLLYFLFATFFARRELINFRLGIDFGDPEFKHLLKLAVPTLLSGSVLQLNYLIMNHFASSLTGAVTSLRQGMTSWTLPYGIIAVGIGNVVLPNLSTFMARGDKKKVRKLYTSSLRRILFFILPFAVAFAILNFDTIQAIFQWNPSNYTADEVMRTAKVMRWFCISMLAQSVIFLTNQAFYARKVTKVTLVVGVFSLVINPLFILLYTKVFKLGLEGIGMAHATYSVLSAILVYQAYRMHKPDYRPYRMLPFTIRLIPPALLMMVLLIALRSIPWTPELKIFQLFVYAVKMGLGFITYYIACLAVGLREARNLQSRIRALLNLRPVEQ
ncbi:MAG: murein biosynthesis integral membrane protein MurJ [Eubacteriales bacterium]|nr:murein biosynthesis integral membrane protein MurJ [Eubacteriales bacterium]